MSLTPSNTFPLPAGTLIVTTEQETHFPVRVKDWNRLREKVKEMEKHRREFSSFAWAMIGIAVAAVFTCIVWIPAFNSLPATDEFEFAWVTPLFVVVAVAAAIMAALGFWAAHLFAKSERASATDILTDMDSIWKPQ